MMKITLIKIYFILELAFNSASEEMQYFKGQKSYM